MDNSIMLGNLLFTLSLLWPYYSLIYYNRIQLNEHLYELILLPVVVLTYICVKWICFGVKNSLTRFVEITVPSIVYLILLIRLFYMSDMSHSLIIGIVGLVSILYSLLFKTKSTLISGGTVIIASVIIQTRNFWLSIQWWVYLLVLGIILIVIASFNEYQKNKSNTGVVSKMSSFFDKFSDWE